MGRSSPVRCTSARARPRLDVLAYGETTAEAAGSPARTTAPTPCRPGTLTWEAWDNLWHPRRGGQGDGASVKLGEPVAGHRRHRHPWRRLGHRRDHHGRRKHQASAVPRRGPRGHSAAEWYFNKGGLISLAYFREDISQLSRRPSSTKRRCRSSWTPTPLRGPAGCGCRARPGATPLRRAYIDADNPVLARQVRDAPGGYLHGSWEFNSPGKDLTFLPWYFKNLGVRQFAA
ncbi:hypothetical protein ACRAWD_13960 [Caulobacter segnis]